MEYINHCSVGLDLTILVKTIPVVLKGSGSGAIRIRPRVGSMHDLLQRDQDGKRKINATNSYRR